MQADNPPQLLSVLTKVTIIGNANGEWQLPPDGATFIFNGTKSPNQANSKNSALINISNGPFAGSNCPFVVSGPFPKNELESLTLQLIEVAESLEKQLHCWPSTGLVTIVLMAKLAAQLDVKRMSLLPSLKRNLTMASDAHLPCIVHNWLGERRIALDLAKANLNWPELYLSSPSSDTGLAPHITSNTVDYTHQCPFELLAKLRQKSLDKTTSPNEMLALLIYLSTSPIESWLQHSSQEKLLASEQMFFNQKTDMNSGFWYLNNNHASQYLDGIRYRLAYCQQMSPAKQKLF
ncbi:hypothetical protein [Shewanella sp. MBTL60-007]|uniref:hypothetical protein n=1 Tax=Shewanella sp. MBTL60-007 TaxID=2815911 RepID=UPI001BBBD9B7|nr:hypothetical protein [Shewanella sp. MBTL60-007]GIU26878.1 hypothetical protein TUM3792_34080 [Shewanella sp. MBTL60-007]